LPISRQIAPSTAVWSYSDRSLTNPKKVVLTDATEYIEKTAVYTVEKTFIITPTSGKAIQILGVIFKRDCKEDNAAGTNSSKLNVGGSDILEATTTSTTYTTLTGKSGFANATLQGLMFRQDEAISIQVWLKTSTTSYWAYMKNIEVTVFYQEF